MPGLSLGLGLTLAAPPALPVPPSGYVFLVDPDGSYLTDPDGSYLIAEA